MATNSYIGKGVGLLVMLSVASAQAQTLTWLGTLNYQSSIADDISADGRVVVGSAWNHYSQPRAFRWENGVMTPIVPFGGAGSNAYGVSADGNVVVGNVVYANGHVVAYRWTARDGMQFLGALGGVLGAALAASADGSVIVGWAEDSQQQFLACRWRAGQGAQALPGLENGREALSVSANGSVIVGYSVVEGGSLAAFRWTETEVRMLGAFGGRSSSAYGVSADGSIVVGSANYPNSKTHAFRWTEQDGLQDIHTLNNSSWSIARDVSDDGHIIVGQYYPTNGTFFRAFRWTPARGMEDLNIVYAPLLSNGSELLQAMAVSADGRFIVGLGHNGATGRREAFLLDTYVPCRAHDGDVDGNGCVDDADLLSVLFAFGQTGQNLGRVDTNCDAVVDDADLLKVLFNFGQGC